MRNIALYLTCLCSVVSLFACADMQPTNSSADGVSSQDGRKSAAGFEQKNGALKMQQVTDPNDPTSTVWAPQSCTPTDDPNCNAVGPYQRLMCDPDKQCRLYIASEKCTYSGFGATSKECAIDTCLADSDCGPTNPDPVNLNASCIVTSESIAGAGGDPFGECVYMYKTCSAMVGTPCEQTNGSLICKNNVCTCSVSGDKSKAQLEVCDGKDNNCDSKTDDGFNVGAKCDGSDSDQCLTGTLTCKSDMLGTECVNEAITNIVEVCDNLDNDCDGTTDEDFPTLGTACDGADEDQCKNGTFVCSTDKKGVVCDEQGGTGNVESCNGKDDNCDGKTDEGCDDDGDGYCDLSMAATAGSACKPGDCDDTDKSIHPGASESCNSKDDNCDGSIDEGIGKGDACSDGLGVCLVVGKKVCDTSGSVVCDAVKKSAGVESCNGLDDSCDGKTDEGCDDDGDGYCDITMSYASGAACYKGDCNDAVSSIYAGATEVCNNIDDNCDGKTDEGCDDDGDGYCDASMIVASGATCTGNGKGTGSDCNDTSATVNPGAKDVCNQIDDNCDGKTDIKSDGTAACDLKCPLVKTITANQEVEIDMATVGTSNLIDSYWCGTSSSALKVVFSGKEVFLTPSAPSGSKFSVKIVSGTGAIIARLQSSCSPNQGTTAVTPVAKGGTCAAMGISSVSGGVVGIDYVVLDAKADGKVTVKFEVTP